MRSPDEIAAAGAERVRFSLTDIPVPMVYATHRIIRDCNAEFAALFGFVRGELVDQSFSRLYPKIADFVRTGEMWRSHLPGGQVYYDERIMAGAGGRRFWCRVNGRSRNQADPFAEALYWPVVIVRPEVGRRTAPNLTLIPAPFRGDVASQDEGLQELSAPLVNAAAGHSRSSLLAVNCPSA